MNTATLVDVAKTTPQGSFVVRRMTRQEVDLAIDWAAAEGWNPGLHDAECFYHADPQGFFVGELDGRPIGCCFAVVYDEAYAFFGGYIVRPEFRHQGFGIEMTRARLAYIGSRNAGLDGVVNMQAKYMRLGFRIAHRNLRYEGIAEGEASPNVSEIHDAARIPFAQLAAYDQFHFSASRPTFLDSWICQPGGVALAAVQSDRLVGYGVVRPCHVGMKIGPLFADNAAIAEDLFGSLSAAAAGQALYLDVPQNNPAAMALAERHAMKPVFETARMYLQGPPSVPMDHIFGITTFELG